MSVTIRAISVLRRLGIIIAIGLTFLFGVVTTVYLSLRSPEIKVPEVVGKDRFEAERVLGDVGLNFRVRATRPSNQSKPDTVLFQLPRAGEVVKVGQTVAMDISRAAKEGEVSEGEAIDKKVAEEKAAENTNTPDVNENRPKRRANVNKNTNENANGNANANVENRNANANRLPLNGRNTNANSNAPTTKPAEGGEVNPNRNNDQKEERRSPPSKPTPAVRNTNTNNP